jgi:hypothetical protein
MRDEYLPSRLLQIGLLMPMLSGFGTAGAVAILAMRYSVTLIDT